jgi:uncharacterized protein (DUF58 family)
VKAASIIGLTIVVLAVALSSGWETMYRLFYTMAATLLLSLLWSWVNVRWTQVSYELKTPRVQVGGQVEEILTIQNSSWIPKLWLEIRDESTLLGRRGNGALALGSHEKRILTLTTPCPKRGEFTIGPMSLISGDPFGLFKRRRKLKVGGRVIVYPAVVPLVSFGQLPGDLPGGSVQGQRAYVTTPNSSGVREYRPGDAVRQIHWLSSARLRRLMVKEFDLDPLSESWLVLDLNRTVQVGSDQDSTEEWGVVVAATLANYFLDQHREVGLVTQGHTIVADRGNRQLHKLLELLAVIHSSSTAPIEELVASEGVRFTRGAVVVIITPDVDESALAAWQLLQARGLAVVAVLLEAQSFGNMQPSLPLAGLLQAHGVPTYLIRKGDDLAHTLAGTFSNNNVN